MSPVGHILVYILFAFLVLLVSRAVIGYVSMLSHFRATGAVAGIFELVYTATDPVLRPLDRLLPPVRIGRVGLSLSFPVAWIATLLLISVARQL